jgi:CBS domain-containing protein
MRGEAHEARDELRYAIAGPAVTAAIAACFGVVALLLPASTPQVVEALVDYQLIVNALILGFNLIPAFPLDGGRVLRSALWRRWGDLGRATSTAASAGRLFGYLLVALGVLELLAGGAQGLWLSLVGVFIVFAAGAQAMSSKIEAALSGVSAGELASTPVVTVEAALSVAQAASGYFLPYRYTSFPVVDGEGYAIGLLTVAAVERLPDRERGRTSVGEIAIRDPELLVGAEEDVATLLTRAAFGRVGRAVVVDELRRPVGLLSVTDVERALRAGNLTGTGQRPGRGANGLRGLQGRP